MTGLIVLITASAVGWIVAVGAFLRRPTAVERPGGMALVPGSDVGPGTGSGVPTATRTPATDLPVPAPDPGHPSGRAEDSPAPGPKPDAAEPPRVSMLLNPGPVPARPASDAGAPAAGDPQSLGRELFARKWLPDDPRCQGGDGLGPLYNADSCLACHNAGGPGGAGAASTNVEVATPIGFAGPPEKHANVLRHQLAGRARDLEEAVALHGGQGAASALEFRTISQSQRSLIHAFLDALVAPGSAGSTDVSRAADAEARDVERTWTEDVDRRAASRLHTAEMLEKMGKTQGALEFYRAVVREAPDSVPGRTASARIKLLGGKPSSDP